MAKRGSGREGKREKAREGDRNREIKEKSRRKRASAQNYDEEVTDWKTENRRRREWNPKREGAGGMQTKNTENERKTEKQNKLIPRG